MSRAKELARWTALDRLRALATRTPKEPQDVIEVQQIEDNVVLTLYTGERLAYKLIPWGPDVVQVEKWELAQSAKELWENFE